LTSKIDKFTDTIRAIEKEKQEVISFFKSTDPIVPSFTSPPRTLGKSTMPIKSTDQSYDRFVHDY
jgi:hypothetical protein